MIDWYTAQFCLLEQCLPGGPAHPFAETMLKHFDKLQSPLKSAQIYPTLQHQRTRFLERGWKYVNCRSLWTLWADDNFLSPQERQALDSVEPFDEFEEFALFASHYFVLLASTDTGSASISSVPVNNHPVLDRDAPTASLVTYQPAYAEFPRTLGQRRYGAIMSSVDNLLYNHGGHGARGRLNTYDVYARSVEVDSIEIPRFSMSGIAPSEGIMCHTITTMSDGTALFVGGRASPEKVSKECYFYSGGGWSKSHDLPFPLYRHSAAAVSIPNDAGSINGIIVHGGRTMLNKIIDTFLLWDVSRGWREVEILGSHPSARFGGCAATFDGSGTCGVLCGGLNTTGTVMQDFWEWKLVDGITPIVKCVDRTNDLTTENISRSVIGRFGAQLINLPGHLLLVGGVIANDILKEEDEMLRIAEDFSFSRPLAEQLRPRPLLVGHAVARSKNNDIVVTGGGAVCFSFGTCWNHGTYTLSSTLTKPWQLVKEMPFWTPPIAPAPPESMPANTSVHTTREAAVPLPVRRCQIESAEDFDAILTAGVPVILENLDIGTCTRLWSSDYLKSKIGERPVCDYTLQQRSTNTSYFRLPCTALRHQT